MTKLVDLVRSVSEDALIEALRSHQNGIWLSDLNGYLLVRDRLLELPVGQTETVLHIDHVIEEGYDFYDVSGINAGSDEKYCLGFTPWSTWLGMEIVKNDGVDLSDPMLLVVILYEMTWWGFDEEQIKKNADTIFDDELPDLDV